MLRIDIFGELSARIGDTVLDLGGRRQRAVLALLLLARGSVVSDDRLIECLWGDDASATSPGALQSYVSHLRRRLDPGRSTSTRESRIRRVGVGYLLPLEDEAVDAWRFERLLKAAGQAKPAEAVGLLTEALELWKGPALAEYAGEGWAQPELARLDELREVAREQLAGARLELGEAAVLVPELEAMVAEAPLREERWRLLVVALYRARRQGDALAALRRARMTLAEELGIDPGPALRALEAEVLAQAETLEAPAREPVAERRPRPPRSPAADGLVDRDREVADLQQLVEAALAGEGRLVLVEGPAGIGKTRLLTEARRLVGDALLLGARGSQLEREFAFGAVRQLFEPVLADPVRREAALAGAARVAAAVFDVPGDGAGDFALLHGLYWLTVNLAGDRPLALVVDDVQWCDTGSLRFLAFLARRLEGLPIVVLASLRTGEEHADAALLAELRLDPGTALVRPGPLSRDGVSTLVRERLGDPADEAFIRACHRTTSGNPLLVRQLLRALESEGVRPDVSHADTVTAIGSRAVSSMVLTRLARLPASASATAQAIAVLGDGHPLPVVAALAGLDEAEAAAAIGVLARAEVLRDEHPLGFVHPLVRDAVYRSIPPGERELRHEKAARVLAAREAPAEQVAAHLLQIPSRGEEWVVDVLGRAAGTATERGATEGAVAYLTRALAERPRPEARAEVLVRLGRTQAMLDGPAAARSLREAYALTADPAERASIALPLAFSLTFGGARGEATAFAREARAALPDGDALVDERQALLALERISGYVQTIDPSLWRRDPLPEVVGDGPGARMLAAATAWELAIDGVDRQRCVALARFGVAGGFQPSVDPGLLWAIAGIALELADADTGTQWDDLLAAAYSGGSLFAALTAQLWRGYHWWRRGDLPEAEVCVATALEQSTAWGASEFGVPFDRAYLIEIRLDRGDLGGARELVDRTVGEPRIGDGDFLYEQAHARVLVAEGRHTEALAHLDRADAIRPDVANPAWRYTRRVRAEALLGLGRRDEAVALLEEELAAACRWGAPSLVGAVQRALGEARGDVAELREAVTLLAGTRSQVEHARALLALAVSAGGDEAKGLLQLAGELAQRCGAAGLAGEVRRALRAAGVEVADETPAPALTTTERRVLGLYADGADEWQIAQRLFLTPHAVRATLARWSP